MPHSSRLAHLEAQAFANTAKIQELSAANRKLTVENEQQEELIARYQSDFSNAVPAPSLTNHRSPPPNVPPTPFYVAARTAPSLRLWFVVPGFKGEMLEYRAETVDLAFVLERTLERKGFGDDMVQKGVLDFLEVPLVKVEWTGREGEIGNLL